MLDGIEDPQNLGAVLRSADGAGVAAVIVPSRRTSPVTAAVARSSAGAVDTVPVIQVANLTTTLQALKRDGYWVYGLDGDAQGTHSEATFDRPTVIVAGAEEGTQQARGWCVRCTDSHSTSWPPRVIECFGCDGRGAFRGAPWRYSDGGTGRGGRELTVAPEVPRTLYSCSCRCSSVVEQRFCKPPVMGSSPFTGSGYAQPSQFRQMVVRDLQAVCHGPRFVTMFMSATCRWCLPT